MNLTDIFPESDVLLSLDPEELGLRLLPLLKTMPSISSATARQLIGRPGDFQAPYLYPGTNSKLLERALREAIA